jgi:hypothetical protein
LNGFASQQICIILVFRKKSSKKSKFLHFIFLTYSENKFDFLNIYCKNRNKIDINAC